MGKDTKIQWCDYTWNGWIGCTKVSPGCANCYAEVATPSRVFGVEWGPGKARKRTSDANWRKPLAWDKAAARAKEAHDSDNGSRSPYQRPRVFCASLSDWLDPEVPIEWLADLLRLIYATPNLDWLLLTKRPELWHARINAVADMPGVRPASTIAAAWHGASRGIGSVIPHNVWIGTTVEDQKRADERSPALLSIPARVRFLSVEPLIESVDLAFSMFDGADSFGAMRGIDWIIVGGESGPNARPCDVEWIRNVVIDCKAADVPVFVKQLGSKPRTYDSRLRWPTQPHLAGESDGWADGFTRDGLWGPKLADRKGGDPDEWPEDLRVRETPLSGVAT